MHGKMLFLLLVATVLAHDLAAAVTVPSPMRKVVGRYALTSANDFQQRDPCDWRLLASNDGGKTWVTLDKRKGEMFSERHQRRMFPIANTNAYSVYRLQIDLVRDPRVANSVQLAEIELMGGAEDDLDPLPIFTDRITSLDDNPPTETAVKLFDGRVETKWLDNKPLDRSTCASWVQWQYAAPGEIVVTNISQLTALRVRANDGYRVRFEGVVVGPTGAGNEWSVADVTGCVELLNLGGESDLQPGQPVVVSGTSLWTNGKIGLKDGIAQPQGAGPAAPPEPMALEQPLNQRDNLKWVEIQGEMRYRQFGDGEISFDVHDTGTAMRVYWRAAADAGTSLPNEARVAVRGLCRGGFNEQGIWVAAGLWATGPKAVTLTADQRGSGAAPADSAPDAAIPGTLTKIEQLRQMTQEQLQRRPHVRFRGVVTELVGAFLQDETAGVQVAFQANEGRKVTEPGSYIEVEGWGGVTEAGNPIVSADRVTVLGEGKWPEPQRMSLSQLMSRRIDAQWVEVEGVIRSTDGAHLLMICYGREVTASLSAGSASRVKGLVDAAVRVRGVGVTALDDRARIQGVHLLIPSLEHVDVIEPPADPEKLPVRSIGSLLGLNGPRESYHRVKVEGVVTLQEDHNLFVQDASSGAVAVLKEEVVLDARFGRSRWLFIRTRPTNAPLPENLRFAPGDRVQLVGFPEARSYSPVLTEVVATKVSAGNVPPVYAATETGLSDGRADSMLAMVEGVLLGQSATGDHRVLALAWNDRTIQVLVPAKEATAVMAIVPGSRLRVTGVCQVDSTPYAQLGLRVASVRLLTRSIADILVLSRPSWWTVQRALMVAGGMAFVLMAATVWITQLHRKVEQRSAQLAAEIHRREQIERQRALEEERARIARDLHDDLGAALTQIRFLSAVESRDQAVPEGTRNQLQLVSEKSRQLVASLDEIVWAINPANDSLQNLANYLCHVAAELFATTQIRCRLDVDDSFPAIGLTSEVRHNLYLAVREALNNIAKHSAASEGWVRIHWKEPDLEIAIEDNGRGYSEAQAAGAGEGLRNMRQRIETIGGRFKCDTTPGIGTVCWIALSLQRGKAATPEGSSV
jgi:signal transduction histidine kinase